MKQKKPKNQEPIATENADHLKKGQEAIKVHQDIFKGQKPQGQKEEEEKKDAEQWHNEG